MEPPKIKIDQDIITPVILANKLKENPDILLRELKEEKGMFGDSMQKSTILAWDTVQRACERRGYEVIQDANIQVQSNESNLNSKEKEALKHCISFHKMYADLIVESLPKGKGDQPTTSKLAQYHRNISQAISDVLEKVERKEKSANQLKTAEINNLG